MIKIESRGGKTPDSNYVEFASGERISTRAVDLRALGCPEGIARRVEERRAQAAQPQSDLKTKLAEEKIL